MAHDDVVAVGVDAHVVGDGEGIVDDGSQHAVAAGHAGDAVNHVVRTVVVEPLAIDVVICGLGAWQKGKCAHYCAAVVAHDHAGAVCDIVEKYFARRVAVDPLPGVAGAAHGVAGLLGQVEQGGQLSLGGVCDVVTHRSTIFGFTGSVRRMMWSYSTVSTPSTWRNRAIVSSSVMVSLLRSAMPWIRW